MRMLLFSKYNKKQVKISFAKNENINRTNHFAFIRLYIYMKMPCHYLSPWVAYGNILFLVFTNFQFRRRMNFIAPGALMSFSLLSTIFIV